MSTAAFEKALSTLDILTLTHLLEDLELTTATRAQNTPTTQANSFEQSHPKPALHLLCLLLQDDFPETRHLWSRLPPDARTNGQTKAAHALAQSLSRGDTASFLGMAESFDWEEELRPVVRILVERVREEGMQLVEKAYSVISIERVRALVGIACDVGDWQVEDGYVQICERKDKSLQNGASGELQRLSEQLVRLQTS